MSGWKYLTCCFPDEATAIAIAGQLGTVVKPGTTDFGNENFACHVFTQWDRWPGTNDKADAGQATAGFWSSVGFDTDKPAGQVAYASLAASPYVRSPANPSNVWAGG